MANDGPGFIVNRCNRPFGLEALRLLQERIADVETIDRICRMEGGFRMGPFELMDLVGVDTGFEISKSFYEQSFGEPRWRPSLIAARYVAAGLHGRKSGRGYYDYPDRRGGSYRPEDPAPLDGGAAGRRRGRRGDLRRERARASELRAAAHRGRLRGALAPRPERRRAAGAGDRLRRGPPRAAERRGGRRPRGGAARTGGARLLLCAQRLARARWTRAAARSASTRCAPLARPASSS